MARLQATAPQQQYFKFFDIEVVMATKSKATYYSAYTGSVSSTNIDYRVTTQADMGVAPMITNGDSYPVRDYSNPFQRTYTLNQFALGFEVNFLQLVSDVFQDSARAKGVMLADSIHLAKEYNFAEFFNSATAGSATNGVLTPDGVTLISASHLLESGVASNVVVGNPALSYVSLAAAKAQIFSAVSHTGNPLSITGPFILMVNPAQYDFARRLTESDRLPGTNDNDPNIAGGQVTVIQNPFFTSTTQWMLIAKPSNPLTRINQVESRAKMDDSTDARNGNTLYSVTTVFGKFPKDWRGVVGSTGLGA